MSTVDPVAQRHQREAARRGSPARTARYVVMQVLQFGCAILLGMGLVSMADEGRVTSLNSVFGNWDSRLMGTFWTFPVGLCGVIMFGIAVSFSAISLTGRPLVFPVIGPATVILIGIAIGFSAAAPQLTPPDQVGVRLDTSFGKNEPWTLGHWVWYYLDVWGPLLLWTFAAAAVVMGAVARFRRRARHSVLAEVAANGARVAGEVTEARLPDPHATRTLTRITVCYVDRSGTTRWIEPPLMGLTSELPRLGDTVTVLYDQNAPGNTKRIFVGPADAQGPDDFHRWNPLV
ncbi:DUF3592 domain-containing protein [Psychromicrobium xiongbiense]|uniref:DUF3592 domain-containing protein n=1 Tax=Psychromicrobium xiongbiense TaxID=3051184 RepID=UPI002553B5F3|nr:DUF3592 domain-containing protein [Psychromicrobium sp. YIM S02556]